MPKTNFIVGLDIGTDTIKLLVAQKNQDEELEIVSQIFQQASGIRKGVVVNPEEVSIILKKILEKVKTETGKKIDSVYVNINGSHLFSISSRGLVSVSRANRRISEEDINRVLQAAQTFSLSSNKEIFNVFPKEFIVDGEKGVKKPLDMEGVRLEAEVLVLEGFSPYLENLTQAVLNSDLQVLDRIPSPIAAAKSCLTLKQKELGVAILDIGAGTSGLCVFEEGDLIHLAVFPIGSANITNDIAIGLKTDIDIAERIKIECGSCLISSNRLSRKKEKIDIGEEEPLIFSQKELVGIIEARVSEIFDLVKEELKKISKEKLLPAGIVLTGGGSKLPKITELAKKELKLPCQLGKPQGFLGLEKDPSLATVSGLVLEGVDMENEPQKSNFNPFKGKIGSKIKKIFKIFIP